MMNLFFSFALLGCSCIAGCFIGSPANNGSNGTSVESRGGGAKPLAQEKNSPAAVEPGSSAQASEIFDAVLSELRQKSRVPLRLPTYLATEEETNPLYAIAEAATVRRYEVMLAFTRDCTGGTACRYGMVSGQAIAGTAKLEKGQAVSLTRGITGYFVDATCGANCSDSTLTWVQDGYRYTVGIKAENVETLIKVANSAVESEPR